LLIQRRQWHAGSRFWKAQSHFAWLGQQPLHLGPQPLVFFYQQLLTIQHWLQTLFELALKDPGQILEQLFNLKQPGGLFSLVLDPLGQGLRFH
jgi:hypothetical protein